jgi:hypothetical protein
VLNHRVDFGVLLGQTPEALLIAYHLGVGEQGADLFVALDQLPQLSLEGGVHG